MYRETVGRWFQYGFTCPLLRQHGARDHTCPWYYGNETEQIIEDIIRLRHTMKPYFQEQLDMLNATGRPFNRPLMWDFPEDPKTWTLAENGIGDSSGPPGPPTPAPPPTPVKDGDFVEVVDCDPSNAYQQWTLDSSNEIKLAGSSNDKFCMDDGGHAGASPPDGPFRVHMWTCQKQFHGAQVWKYDHTSKQLQGHGGCLELGSNGHPTLDGCSSSSQQWSFTPAGGAISAGGNKCLGVVASSGGGGGGGIGVIDQYMVGDDYMAAPIFNLGQRARMVYFPLGTDWTHAYTKQVYKGGTTAAVPAPLNTFPLFKRTDNAE